MIREAVTQAANSMKNVLQQVRGTAGVAPEPAKKLTTQQQLDIFSKLTDDDFTQLRQVKGDAAVEEYTRAMMRLARNQE